MVRSYLDTYLTKDVRTLAQIGDMRDFRKLIQLLAANVSQTLDYTYYANEIGISSTTIKRWVSILEASYIIFLLPPYYHHFENYIVSEVLKKIKHTASSAELYFLRTQDKAEIDLTVDQKTQRDFFEIKKSSTYTAKMSSTLKKYAEENDHLFVLYNGESFRHGGVDVLDYKDYLS